MSKVTYDNTGVESQGGGGTEPKPDVYPARIAICEVRKKRADGTPTNDLHVAFDLGGDFRWLHTYISFGEPSKWKMKEFTSALGLPEKGSFDDKKQVGKTVRLKVNAGEYEGSYSAQAGRIMKAGDDDEVAAPADEPDVPVDNDGGGDDAPATDEFVPSREADCGSYDEWTDADLLAEVEDRQLQLPGGRGNKRDKCITTLREDDTDVAGGGGDDDPPADGAAGSDDDSAPDYSTWTVEQLVEEFKQRSLEDPPKKGRGAGAVEAFKAAIVERLEEDDNADPFA